MPNHFHLIVEQRTTLPISKLLAKVCTSYGMRFNKKYDHVGHLFQDQFKAVKIETDPQLMWLSAYIHQNPVTAGLVARPEDYRWSSYRDYIGQSDEDLCDKDLVLSFFKNLDEYKDFVESSAQKIQERKLIEEIILE